MACSVREHISSRQAGYPCHVIRFSALAQVSGHTGSILGTPGVLLAIVLVIILVTVVFALLVIYPAVWSRKSYRRKAALEVLQSMLRWRR